MKRLVPVAAVPAVACFLAAGLLAQSAPRYVFDPGWPKPLPNKWKIGGVTGLAVDRNDDVWVLNRPNDLTDIELHAELTPAIADCCVRPPSMIHISKDGDVIGSFDAPQGHGMDVDSNGVVWTGTASGHLVSFDRRKCKGPLNGPKATGDHCPEGWSFYKYPGPGFAGIGDNSAESSYYTWVDQHNTFGLGEDVPMSTANLMGGLVAFRDGGMISLRVPYPLGFYAKGFDGRIDDPNAGWKGRGLWTTSGDRAPWLMEGGKGRKPIAVHFQLRPDPLAR